MGPLAVPTCDRINVTAPQPVIKGNKRHYPQINERVRYLGRLYPGRPTASVLFSTKRERQGFYAIDPTAIATERNAERYLRSASASRPRSNRVRLPIPGRAPKATGEHIGANRCLML